jgi:hypothetical protein
LAIQTHQLITEHYFCRIVILMRGVLIVSTTTIVIVTMAMAATAVTMMIPTAVRNSLPGLYHAPLAWLDITRDAITNEVHIAETMLDPTTTTRLTGICFLVRRPG